MAIDNVGSWLLMLSFVYINSDHHTPGSLPMHAFEGSWLDILSTAAVAGVVGPALTSSTFLRSLLQSSV